MAASKSTPENQARLSIMLACIGAIGVLGAVALLGRNYNGELKQFMYASSGKFLPMFLGALMVSVACGIAGFALGFNSAGQKKHTQPRLSWIGFFMSAALLAASMAIFAAFWVMKMPISIENKG